MGIQYWLFAAASRSPHRPKSEKVRHSSSAGNSEYIFGFSCHTLLLQIGYRNGEIKAQYSYQDKIIMNVAESEVFQYYKKLDRSIQLMSVPIQSKVRRSGRRKSVGDAVGSQAVYGAQALHHVRMGSANDLVAGLVHFLSLDPEVLWIREVS